jgi:hypothetical protein
MSVWDCEALAEGNAMSRKNVPIVPKAARDALALFLEQAAVHAASVDADDRAAWIVGWLLGQSSLCEQHQDRLAAKVCRLVVEGKVQP